MPLTEFRDRKKISPVELTKACLARIEQFNPTLNAFITIGMGIDYQSDPSTLKSPVERPAARHRVH